MNLLGEDSTSRYFINILADFKPPEVPILPSALAVFRERAATAGKDFSLTRCLPSGLPVAEFAPEPRKIIQMPGLIVVLYEADMSFRQIYMDGRKLPVDPQPTWLGYSVARWEDDTWWWMLTVSMTRAAGRRRPSPQRRDASDGALSPD